MSLQEVAALIEIPADVDRLKVVDHANRVATLTRAWSTSGAMVAPSEQRAYGDILAVGIALSWACDLKLGKRTQDRQMNTGDLAGMAFPGAGGNRRLRAALKADLPRFVAAYDFRSPCAVGGPRGGKCPGWKRSVRWVADMETGVWVWRNVCQPHRAIADKRVIDAPRPPANAGGILTAAFPEYDFPVLYRWVSPEWVEEEPPGTVILPGKPKLTVILGDG